MADTNGNWGGFPFPCNTNGMNMGEWIFGLIVLAMFGNNGFFGNRGENGGPRNMGYATAELAGLNSAQIDAIRAKASEIEAAVNCGNMTSQQILGAVQTAAASLNDKVCALGHSVDMANLGIQNKIAECCCSTKQAMSDGFCGIEKSILQQTNTIQNGFSATAFQNERQTSAILQTIKDEGSATRAQAQAFQTQNLLAHKDEQLEAQKARISELEASAQTAVLLQNNANQTNQLVALLTQTNSALAALSAAVAKIPTTTA